MDNKKKQYGFICETCKRYVAGCKTADEIYNINRYPFLYSEDPRHDLFYIIFKKCKVKEVGALNE